MNQKQREARKTPEGKAKEAAASRRSYYKKWGQANFPKWPVKVSELCENHTQDDGCSVCKKVVALGLAVG